MIYSDPLPSIRKLSRLAEWDGPFPMKSSRIVIGAERFGFDDETIGFLQLFPGEVIFVSRDDFLDHCRQLRSMIRKKRELSDVRFQSPLIKLSLIRLLVDSLTTGTKHVNPS